MIELLIEAFIKAFRYNFEIYSDRARTIAERELAAREQAIAQKEKTIDVEAEPID